MYIVQTKQSRLLRTRDYMKACESAKAYSSAHNGVRVFVYSTFEGRADLIAFFDDGQPAFRNYTFGSRAR